MKLTTHLHLVPRSRIHGVIPPLPSTPLWRGVQFKHTDSENNEFMCSVCVCVCVCVFMGWGVDIFQQFHNDDSTYTQS